MAAEREHDFEVELSLLPDAPRSEEPLDRDGMELEYALDDGARAIGTHFPVTDGRASGEPWRARVALRRVAAYPRSLWPNREVALFRGERRVGSARVLNVRRAVLDAHGTAGVPEADAATVVCAMVEALDRKAGTFHEHLASLRLGESLQRVGRRELRACLAEQPGWVDAWYRWADEHRLRTGPFLFRYKGGGWAGYYECSGVALESERFDDPVHACAAFLVLELEESRRLFD